MNSLPGSTIKWMNDQLEQSNPVFQEPENGPGMQRCTSDLSFLFTLECLVGSWEGIITRSQFSVIKVWLRGFPPLAARQRIAVYQAGKKTNEPVLLYEGVIHDIQVNRGGTCWEGSTEFLMNDYCLSSVGKEFEDGSMRSWLRHPSSPLIGRILEQQSPARSSPSERTVTGVTGNFIAVPALENSSRAKGLQSMPVTIPKPNGQIIRGFSDAQDESWPAKRPVVVIAPGYGETKRDYLTLSYYLASNGFRVVRYDHTNHVGMSDGDHFNFTLSSMKEDFLDTIDFVRTQWPGCPVIGLASSMAARVALKAEAEHPSVDQLVLMVGIVNVQRTVAAVHLEDVFTNFLQGHCQSSANILGFNVGQQFLRDACQNHFVTLADTLQDARRLTTPVMMVSAGNDIWVEEDDLKKFQAALGERLQRMLVMPGSLHRIQENPRLARQIYRQVVIYCQNTCGISKDVPLIQEPDQMTLGRQNRLEKHAPGSKLHSKMETGFWKEYLQNFQAVGNCVDYLTLLDHMFHALGPIAPAQRILDVGCGNGTALQYISHGLSQFPLLMKDVGPVYYLGIDVIADALKRAKQSIENSGPVQPETSGPSHHGIKPSWAQVDLHKPLPFADHSFDRILSNLVLGYITTPAAALKELYRVLAPGGRMVISNLKPDGDFSAIYQRLVSHAQDSQEREQARELLNNYGKIRQAEKEGQFQFFTWEQWRQILDALGQQEAQIFPAFSNQAYLIVIEKPATPTTSVHSPTPALPQCTTLDVFSSPFKSAA